MRRGFTLIEVVIALLVLEVGLLGAVGMTIQAQRTLSRIAIFEAVAQAVESVADSLSRVGWSGPGSQVLARGDLRWARGGGGLVILTFQERGGPALSVGLYVGESGAP